MLEGRYGNNTKAQGNFNNALHTIVKERMGVVTDQKPISIE